MSEQTNGLPTRDEIPKERTWDLEDIFATDDLWEEALEKFSKDMHKIETYKETLHKSANQLYEALQLQDELSERFGKIYVYARLRSDEDTTNEFYQSQLMRAETILSQASSLMSFIEPEILQIDETTIEQFLEEKEELKLYDQLFKRLFKRRNHVLSAKEEALLAKASEPLQGSSQTFKMLNDADLTFPTIKDEQGKEVEVTHGRYIRFLESKDRRVRKDAFYAMHETYEKFKHTFASTLTNKVTTDNFFAEVRNYESARHAALSRNHIPETVYDHLIEVVHEKLPLLHRYIRLRKKALQLDKLHMYDLYVPFVPEVEMKVTYEEAQQYILEGLQPLGENYIHILEKAFKERWIDVEENKGKRSGAYSSGTYGTHPYILLNWQNKLNDLFTLAHELGHSVHSYYTRKNQPFRYGHYSIFVAEVASTCNEILLSAYLLEHLKEPEVKQYILNHFLESFRAVVYRQTKFAEFEHNIHQQIQEGEALPADQLSKMYLQLNEKYYGKDVISDREIGFEWARVPHFYYNYYVYQYATGYAAATTLAKQILEQKEGAVSRYIEFLKAGSSEDPIDVLKTAGVDMTSKQPLYDAFEVFEANLKDLEAMLAK